MGNLVALFYNPVAGGGRFRHRLDLVVQQLQPAGLRVLPWRISSNRDIHEVLKSWNPDDFHSVVAAGGDGTIHGLVNAMMKAGFNVPLAIFPEGTTNDTARYFNIGGQVEEYCRALTCGRLVNIDLGKANEEYFINAAVGGTLSEIGHEVEYRWKNLLGRGAYYLTGLKKFAQMQLLSLQVVADGQSHALEASLFIVLNSGTTAGIQWLPKDGIINDGRLDFLAIRPAPLARMCRHFLHLMKGGRLHNRDVFHCQARHLTIDALPCTGVDTDGESGPSLPWEVRVCPSALKLRLPE